MAMSLLQDFPKGLSVPERWPGWPERWPWIAGGLASSLVVYFYVKRTAVHTTSGGSRPPGPKRRPIVGNVRDFPANRWFEKFCEWQKEYGDVVYLDLMGRPLLIVNSVEDAEELANKRANNYSNRPIHMIVTEMMELNWSLTVIQPNKEFNEQRKVFRKVIGPQSVASYDSLVTKEAKTLVEDLSGFSGDPIDKIEASVAAVIIKLAYGEKIHREHGRELIDLNTANIHHISDIRTRFYLVTVFHWLRYIPEWFPGAHFQTVARVGKELVRKVRSWGFELVVKDMEDGVADASVLSSFLNDEELPRESLRDSTAALYGGMSIYSVLGAILTFYMVFLNTRFIVSKAGVDTTSSVILSYFYHMAIYPDIQQKVQKELDENFGRGQIPSVEDSFKLEYLEATWKESFRMAPPVPLGLPHQTREADSWKGYYIPKKTTVMFNIGFMMKDPRIWGSDVQHFRPERFLGAKAKDLPDVLSIPFGWGKRICPGRFFANRQGRAFVAAILSVYDILPVDGEKIPNPILFNDSLIRRPSDFRCQFRPRSEV